MLLCVFTRFVLPAERLLPYVIAYIRSAIQQYQKTKPRLAHLVHTPSL